MSIKIPKQILLPALAVLAFVTFPAPGFAQTPQPIPVTNNLDFTPPAPPIPGSLRDAVSKAKDGDTVSISAAVTAPIILTGGEIQILRSITIQGAGADNTTLNGNSTTRIFEIGDGLTANPSVKITGVTILNGFDGNSGDGGGIRVDKSSSLRLEDSHIGPGNTSVTDGGGIASEGGFLTVVNSTIEGNHGLADGGIVCSDGGTLDLKNTIVSNNLSDGEGGGIGMAFGCKSALIDTCTISGNTAKGSGGTGGGINNSGGGASTTILNSVITGNHAPEATTGGGGGIANFSVIKIDHTTISNNDTTGNGGGILNDGDAAITITNTTISDNHSNGANSNGGGIFFREIIMLTTPVPVDVSNATIFGNDANGSGGGIFNDNERLHLNNVTIAHNIADKDKDNTGDGGGIVGNNMITINNTLIADNLDNSAGTSTVANDCDSSVVSEGHNLIGVLVAADCDINADPTDVTNQPAGLDPNGLQANGSSGPLTVALLSGSRAIDAGDPATAVATDERGFVRQGSGPDIGAFEFGGLPPATPIPTPTPPGQDNSGGGCALAAAADFGPSGLGGLLSLAAVGFAVLRRRVK